MVTGRWRRATMTTRHGRRHPSALVTAVAGRRVQSVGSETLDERTGGHHALGHGVARLQSPSVGIADQSRIRDTVTERQLG